MSLIPTDNHTGYFNSARALRRALSTPVARTLAWPHGVDRYLDVINPMWSVQAVRARITRVQHLTTDSVTLTLQPNANWQGFVPGQFVQLSAVIDGVRRTRCYSPANSMHAADGHIELTIKAHAEGFVSRYLKDHAAAGMVVGLSQADGEFQLPVERPQRTLLISGGSGITPVMAMLRTLCDEGHGGRITFLHYANSAADTIYADELAAIAVRYPHVELLRSFAHEDSGELQGFFSRAQLAAAVPDYAEAAAFLCGPPPMMRSVQTVWQEDGITAQLHLEHFTAAAVPAAEPGDSAEGELRFSSSERWVANDGRNILEQAEAAGLSPEAGCRMGICHTCTCRKTAGTVRNLQTGELSSAPDEEIQICISAPIGTVTLDL